jgi:hypothetical protein
MTHCVISAKFRVRHLLCRTMPAVCAAVCYDDLAAPKLAFVGVSILNGNMPIEPWSNVDWRPTRCAKKGACTGTLPLCFSDREC